jgi:hypothetical protein
MLFMSWDTVVDTATNLGVEWARNVSIPNRSKALYSPHPEKL